jgi:U-box domain
VVSVPLQASSANRAAMTPAADHPAAESDWWRCPLSGEAMRDPVLYGSGGHSFEREALKQWLAANPGVDPLSRQPLPLGRDTPLPNHALRNVIQQLGLGWLHMLRHTQKELVRPSA